MRNDPLVEEARQTGQKYIDSFKGDWQSIIADLERRAREEGRKTITLPRQKPQIDSISAKKAG